MATYESIRYSFGGSLVTALQSPNMADGSVTNTEFEFINTLTSNAQTQIDTKFGSAGGTFTGNVTLADNVDLNFGNGNDMIITSNGTASFIKGNAITIEDTSGNDMANFVANGASKLFFGGTQKLETTNTGTTIAGTLAAGSLQGDGTNITALAAANITSGGTLPSLVGTALTSLNAANLIGTYPALNGGSITSINASNVASGTLANARLPSSISVSNVSGNGSGLTSLNASNLSSGTVPTARLPSLGLSGGEFFTANGTWTCPAGVTTIFAIITGGGGGAGGQGTAPSIQYNTRSGAGGSGGNFEGIIAVTPGTTYNIVIGAGGACGNNSNTGTLSPGAVGGNTTAFGITATGGGGGSGSYTGTTGGNPNARGIRGTDGSASGTSVVAFRTLSRDQGSLVMQGIAQPQSGLQNSNVAPAAPHTVTGSSDPYAFGVGGSEGSNVGQSQNYPNLYSGTGGNSGGVQIFF